MASVDSFQFLYREMSRSCNPYFETLALVGAIYTASRAVILLRECCSLVRVHFLPRLIPNKKKLSQRFGDWAIVYGKAAETNRVHDDLDVCDREERRVRFMHFILGALQLDLGCKSLLI